MWAFDLFWVILVDHFHHAILAHHMAAVFEEVEQVHGHVVELLVAFGAVEDHGLPRCNCLLVIFHVLVWLGESILLFNFDVLAKGRDSLL